MSLESYSESPDYSVIEARQPLRINSDNLFELHKAADKWLWDAKSDGTVKSVNNARCTA